MGVFDLVKRINSKGIRIKVVGDKLNISGAREALDEQLIAEITQHKQELLASLQSAIPLALPKEGYGLTSAQERFWILSKFEGANKANIISNVLILNGDLKVSFLEQAFSKVVNRHESLRTYFKEDEGGQVRQYIVPVGKLNFNITHYDLTDGLEGHQQKTELIEDYLSIPFDLSTASLLRVCLLKLADDQHILVYALHHIIGDGWSMQVLINEITQLYNALINNKEIVLPELIIQYKDYAEWMASRETYLEEQMVYWVDKFSSPPPLLDLPIAVARPVVKTYEGASSTLVFSRETAAGIGRIAAENNVTRFTVLMAAVNALLYRYTNDKDIIIGIPVAGRNHSSLENQVGLFINTLPIRTRFKEGVCFYDLLQIQREELFQSYAHQNYPFDHLVHALNIKRDVSRSPLFDIMVVLQNHEDMKIHDDSPLTEIEIKEYEELRNKYCQFDLIFNFSDNNGLIKILLDYNTDLFDGKFIGRMVHHLELLLAAALVEPLKDVRELEMLTSAEQQQILYGFNDTRIDYPREQTVVSLIEERVTLHPDHIAYVYQKKKSYKDQATAEFDEIEVSYHDFWRKSNQFANYLISKFNVRDSEFVCLILDKSEWLLPVIIGVLKTGGVYIPIDPHSPETRQNYFKELTNCRVIITEKVLEEFIKNCDQYSVVSPEIEINADHLFHVMFTSGSTGAPKGVILTNKNVIGLIKPCSYVNLNEDTVLLSTVSVSWDATNFEFWAVLVNGGKLILMAQDYLLDHTFLKQALQYNKVNTLWLTTSWFKSVVEQDITIFEGLTHFLTGGEKIAVKHVNQLMDQYPDLNIINCYGPTEDTTFSTTFPVKRKYDSPIPIGKPLDNGQAYILNEKGMVQPIGITGVLYLAGIGIAQGYYKNESLTQEKFLKNPFESGGKMYYTGDYAKWNEDGDLLFIGRVDNQVKIRGKTIDTIEIENTLNKYEHIKQSLVDIVMFENEPTIVAYILSEGKAIFKVIKEHLSTELPFYMVPQVFIEITHIPLSSTGKTDKTLLPPINGYSFDSFKDYVPPANDIEEALVNIWKEILQVDRISINDDFFELGGHSLKATRLLSAYAKEFKVKLDFAELFSNVSLESQALLIKNAVQVDYEEIPKLPLYPSYDVSSAQYRLWILSQFDEESSAYNIPFLIRLKGEYNIDNFIRAVYAVVERHEILRTVFRTDAQGKLMQHVLSSDSIGFNIDFEDVEHFKKEYRSAESYFSNDYLLPFDLASGPLIRASLVRENAESYVFYCNMHHIISDGWSMDILKRDVLAYYESFQNNKLLDLPMLNIQYKDYAAWQLAQLNLSSNNLHKEYWLNELSGMLPVIDLPSSKSRLKVRTYNGSSISFNFPAVLNEQLKDFQKVYGGTLFMNLLAAWNILFYKYTGEKDFILGTPIAGRNHTDLNEQIGCYVNTLALRNEVRPEESFLSFYNRIKDGTLMAYAHQNYPFDVLVEDLKLEQHRGRNPIFDMMLVVQNEEQTATFNEVQNLENLSLDNGYQVAKFDIELNFRQEGEEIIFKIIYNTDLYEREMISSLMQHYLRLLEVLITSPEEEIRFADYLEEKEKTQLVDDFNQSAVEFPHGITVIDLFKSQVARFADRAVIEYQDTTLTYKELDVLSNQLANYLISNYETAAGSLVGLKLERGVWFIISVLAVLKTGNAYLPIDLSYPEQRIEFIKQDSACKFIIDRNFLHHYQADGPYPDILSAITISPSDLAYVIYTSGSTGRPKGVMVGHSSLYNLCCWHHHAYALDEHSRCTFFAGVGFDASVWEIFPVLTSGGCIYPLADDNRSNTDALIEIYNEQRITHSFLPTVLYNDLARKSSELSHRLKLLVGGEALSVNSSDSKIELYNNYGPTENTVVTCYYKVKETDYGLVPIGKPISNVSLYVLDNDLNLVPVGVEGELCIAGNNLALGYWNDEELTSQKFIYHARLGKRIYKTGDLVCWLPDGNIEFLRRKDEQVKIRGHRIELGEIENCLLDLDEVAEATVLVKTVDSEKIIVAYVVVKDGRMIDIRAALKERLPDYMIPAFFVKLDQLPVTANGKVDKHELLKLEFTDLFNIAAYVPPDTQLQRDLVALWEEILERNHIGINDSFFSLGGHSLKAARMIARIQQLFKVKVEFKELYNEPTIAYLSAYISSLQILNNQTNDSLTGAEDLFF